MVQVLVLGGGLLFAPVTIAEVDIVDAEGEENASLAANNSEFDEGAGEDSALPQTESELINGDGAVDAGQNLPETKVPTVDVDQLLEEELGVPTSEPVKSDLDETDFNQLRKEFITEPRKTGKPPPDRDPVSSKTIATESVDTGQAEAAAERERRLLEKEAEIRAKQRELARRARIERALDEQIQDLKEEALLLGEELSILSEKLIYPSSTQVVVFLAVSEVDEDFLIDAIELSVNGLLVGSHLYTLREIEALRRGGRQRIYDGNLHSGDHFLELTLHTRVDDEVNTLNWRYDFNKGSTPHYIELDVLEDSVRAQNW